MPETGTHIRRATRQDLPALSRFGAQLARRHVGFDADRFTLAEPAEPVFLEFFAEQLAGEDVVMLVAERHHGLIGYAFVRMEGASLEDLRGRGAWLHDIYVDEAARGQGVGRMLLQAALEAAGRLGSGSLMLAVSPKNGGGRRLFEEAGFRTTMLEMRVEIDRPNSES